MKTYHIETKLTENSKLTLTDLPFQAGEKVEVIVLKKPEPNPGSRYPLRGLPITFVDPTGPVAEEEWEASQ